MGGARAEEEMVVIDTLDKCIKSINDKITNISTTGVTLGITVSALGSLLAPEISLLLRGDFNEELSKLDLKREVSMFLSRFNIALEDDPKVGCGAGAAFYFSPKAEQIKESAASIGAILNEKRELERSDEKRAEGTKRY